MIPVNEPVVSEQAKRYVNDALDTGWISSAGKYVTAFEEQFAAYLGVQHAATVSNGTAALHVALAALGVQEGDEVIVPDLTIISCAYAVVYLGAKPVLVDVVPETGNIDPSKIEAAITAKTKAIMVVHLYGHPAEMDAIMAIARKHGVAVVEDAAEAHGAVYRGRKAGSIGDIACFSFYGNKIVTSGEGGMVVSNNEELMERVRLLKDLAHKPGRRFFHEVVGYNYRMTNVQAALGLGELENIETYIERKRAMAALYHSLLTGVAHLKLPGEASEVRSVYWMYALELLPDAPLDRDAFMQALRDKGVDTRTYFYPLHAQPVLANAVTNDDALYPVTSDLARRGLYLPSGLALTQEQQHEVARAVAAVLGR